MFAAAAATHSRRLTYWLVGLPIAALAWVFLFAHAADSPTASSRCCN